MSQLPPKAIDEFQSLWKKHYGEELPREAAVKRAHEVFHLMELLFTSSALMGSQEATSPTPDNTSA